MNVLIKGMELPEDCASCIFKINKHCSGDEWYYACVLNSKDIFEDEKGRLQDCPLIEMPEFNIIKKAPIGGVALMKHGKWIYEGHTSEPSEPFYSCSVCQYVNYKASKFCPNCGAKMDGREDD